MHCALELLLPCLLQEYHARFDIMSCELILPEVIFANSYDFNPFKLFLLFIVNVQRVILTDMYESLNKFDCIVLCRAVPYRIVLYCLQTPHSSSSVAESSTTLRVCRAPRTSWSCYWSVAWLWTGGTWTDRRHSSSHVRPITSSLAASSSTGEPTSEQRTFTVMGRASFT